MAKIFLLSHAAMWEKNSNNKNVLNGNAWGDKPNFQHCITRSDRWQSWDYVIFLMKQQSVVKVQFSKWLSQIIYRGTNSQGLSFKKWTLKAKSIRQSGRARQETKLTGKKMNTPPKKKKEKKEWDTGRHRQKNKEDD